MNARVDRRDAQLFSLVVMMLLLGVSAAAQEFRGSINGRVTDASGGAVPGAEVTITNLATNTTTTTKTNESGEYTALYLTPGRYTVTVEAKGFKKLVRQNIEVRVGDKLALDLVLDVGEVQETVSVTSEAPLLQTNTASAGQVIDRRRISELPLSDGNPFVLSRLAPGITYTGDLKFSRPFDNAGTSSVVTDGAPGRNEFTLDGTPNMASGGGLGRVAFVPPADAVQEFKVETANFDAQQGHTAGANINVTLKSGTNDFHGTVYEFVRNDVLSGNDFFINASPSSPKDENGKAKRSALRYNRYGATVGGPILLPRFGEGGPALLNGRNRSFFFFAYEGLKDVFPEPGQFTVPTLAERNGDLSALLSQGIVIYDPLTARRRADGRIERTPFPNNVIPQSRLSPIALNYLKFYPLPNQPGDAQGRNNYISPNPRSDTFHSESVRVDHTFTEKQRAFFRYTHNNRREARGNWTGVVNGIRPTGNFLFRINNGATYDHVYTISPTTIFNFRAGFSRFWEPNVRQHQGEFNPASLGFSARTASFFGGASYLPRFRIRDDDGPFSPLGDSFAGGTSFNIYSVQPTVTKIIGDHSLRIGYDFRAYRENSRPSLHAAGRYDFGTDFTRQLDNSPSAAIGQELAAFLLGQPTGGLIDRSAFRSNQTLYQGAFVQDDWKVTRRLTLNLGLRYEFEGATTERYNRNIRGFDTTSSNPIEAAARAAYAAAFAANPSLFPITPDNFRVRGGLLFATEAERGFYRADKNNFQPRIGFAYQWGEKTVVRGGWAIYTVPFVMEGIQQPGFSQATQIVPSLDTGLTFRANLFDPFPDGVADPPGASLGLATFLGRDIDFFPVDGVRNGQAQRWELSVQRELPGQWLVELSYVGNRGYDLLTGINSNDNVVINAIPRQYLSTRPVRDDAVINFLTTNVPNPFRGLPQVAGTGLSGNTVQRQQLLRPFPEFGRIRTRRFDGSSIYHGGQLRVERRFTRGYTILSSYTWSKYLERVSFLNETDTDYEKRISRDDVTHRLVVSGIWELPFGRGRRFGNNWRGAPDAVLGGWQVQAIWQTQSGRPLDLSDRNVFYNGDPSKLRANISGSTLNRTFDTSGFYFSDAQVQTNGVVDPAKQRNDPRINLANNIRTFPTRLPGFRGQPLNLWDISVIKNIAFTETVKFQLRGEFLNAFNHPQFEDPNTDPRNSNFGRVTGQNNLPRNVQIGLKLLF
jgi:hypothetical protein